MDKLIMRVGDVIKFPQKNLWGLVGVGIDIKADKIADIKAVKTAVLKKGSTKLDLSILDVQIRNCFGDNFTVFLTTNTPVDSQTVMNAEVFADSI